MIDYHGLVMNGYRNSSGSLKYHDVIPTLSRPLEG